MLNTVCGERCVEKTRHSVPHAGFIWAVDVYEGQLATIVLAEIELSDEKQAFEKPDWAGTEITNDPDFITGPCFVCAQTRAVHSP